MRPLGPHCSECGVPAAISQTSPGRKVWGRWAGDRHLAVEQHDARVEFMHMLGVEMVLGPFWRSTGS